MAIDFSQVNEDVANKIQHFMSKHGQSNDINEFLTDALELLEQENKYREHVADLLQDGIEDLRQGRVIEYSSLEEMRDKIISECNEELCIKSQNNQNS